MQALDLPEGFMSILAQRVVYAPRLLAASVRSAALDEVARRARLRRPAGCSRLPQGP
ncbi:hypothetical protein ACRAWF_34875 [Streptomyces sp. L7]